MFNNCEFMVLRPLTSPHFKNLKTGIQGRGPSYIKAQDYLLTVDIYLFITPNRAQDLIMTLMEQHISSEFEQY